MARKESYCGIYEIRHIPSGRRYIGSAANIYNRWSTHKCHLRRGTHGSKHLQRVWSKYGEEQFKFNILHICGTDQLQDQEQRFMDSTPKGLLLNLAPQARTMRGWKMSEEQKRKISETQLRVSEDPNERRRRSERAKKQHAEGKLRRKIYKLSDKVCKTCAATFSPARRPNGTPEQSKYCLACRPKQWGGRYNGDRVLDIKPRPCKKCGQDYIPERFDNGVPNQSRYCIGCRPKIRYGGFPPPTRSKSDIRAATLESIFE